MQSNSSVIICIENQNSKSLSSLSFMSVWTCSISISKLFYSIRLFKPYLIDGTILPILMLFSLFYCITPSILSLFYMKDSLDLSVRVRLSVMRCSYAYFSLKLNQLKLFRLEVPDKSRGLCMTIDFCQGEKWIDLLLVNDFYMSSIFILRLSFSRDRSLLILFSQQIQASFLCKLSMFLSHLDFNTAISFQSSQLVRSNYLLEASTCSYLRTNFLQKIVYSLCFQMSVISLPIVSSAKRRFLASFAFSRSQLDDFLPIYLRCYSLLVSNYSILFSIYAVLLSFQAIFLWYFSDSSVSFSTFPSNSLVYSSQNYICSSNIQSLVISLFCFFIGESLFQQSFSDIFLAQSTIIFMQVVHSSSELFMQLSISCNISKLVTTMPMNIMTNLIISSLFPVHISTQLK